MNTSQVSYILNYLELENTHFDTLKAYLESFKKTIEGPQLQDLQYSECIRYIPTFNIAKCVRCYDGDTIHLAVIENGRAVRYSCRLNGIDTAEKRTRNPLEKIVSKFQLRELQKIVGDQIVQVKIYGCDKYGRVLADVITHEGINVSQYMIEYCGAFEYNGGTKTKNFDYQILIDRFNLEQ